MSEQCHEPECKKSGEHFIDCTAGPLCDYRHYCDEHIEAARDRLRKDSDYRSLRYDLSLAKRNARSAMEYVQAAEDKLKEFAEKWT